jgi:5-methylthioribose kinase
VLLDVNDLPALEGFLAQRGWLEPGERLLGAERAGEGNMNLTLRVRTTTRSVIVKQGRPWVEKYPTIAAPAERTLLEAKWYALAGRVASVAARLPKLLAVDQDAKVLLMADLGARGDYLHLYCGGELGVVELDALVDWLLNLHGSFAGDPAAAQIKNIAMRQLNHEHIFEVPLRADNGLDLDAITPGLSAVAAQLRLDQGLLDAIDGLGARYMAVASTPGAMTLLHGDYYPGSWLQADEPWIIDPEFGFFGRPEFDLGVMLAHLDLAAQPAELAEHVLRRYTAAASRVDVSLARGFAGVEVMRRLLGVSQLPISFDLEGKRELIERARTLIEAS